MLYHKNQQKKKQFIEHLFYIEIIHLPAISILELRSKLFTIPQLNHLTYRKEITAFNAVILYTILRNLTS